MVERKAVWRTEVVVLLSRNWMGIPLTQAREERGQPRRSNVSVGWARWTAPLRDLLRSEVQEEFHRRVLHMVGTDNMCG